MKVKDLIRVCVTDTNYKFYFNKNMRYAIPEELYQDINKRNNPNNIRNLKQIYNRDIILKDNVLLDMEILSIIPTHKNHLLIRLKTDKRIGYKNNREGRFLI